MTGFRVESRLSAMSVTTITSHGSLSIEHLGIVDYQQTWEKQRLLHHEIAENKRAGTLLLLEHFSVYTAGRRTLPHERPFDGTPVIDVDRGGKITWHGPGLRHQDQTADGRTRRVRHDPVAGLFRHR